MMKHPQLRKFEARLHRMLAELDDLLENRFGQKYPLHPARARRGSTSSKAHDGLFSTTASYTLGIGSQWGKGYVIDLHLSTLSHVPAAVQHEIRSFALARIRSLLPEYFPHRKLQADPDGTLLKIHGDLSLGEL